MGRHGFHQAVCLVVHVKMSALQNGYSMRVFALFGNGILGEKSETAAAFPAKNTHGNLDRVGHAQWRYRFCYSGVYDH